MIDNNQTNVSMQKACILGHSKQQCPMELYQQGPWKYLKVSQPSNKVKGQNVNKIK